LNAFELQAARRQALTIVFGQLAGAGVLAIACAVGSGPRAAFSAVAGGVIGALATAYMAFAMLRSRAGINAAGMAGRFYLGWAIKVVMTVALLVLAFRSKYVVPLALLGGYLVTVFAYTIGAARNRPRRRK
jgi:F0F1-type ATP synthase assembly protein I